MKITDAPKKMPVPFGINGLREEIPDTTVPGDNTASYSEGFPRITMAIKAAGGLPPKGQDMNAILYELADNTRFAQAGTFYPFDQDFANATGGYPKGGTVVGSDGKTLLMSLVDSNTTDPKSSMTNWTPVAGAPNGLKPNGDLEGTIWGGLLSKYLDSRAPVITVKDLGHNDTEWSYYDPITKFLRVGGYRGMSSNRLGVTFPKAFTSSCFGVQLTLSGDTQPADSSNNPIASEVDMQGFVILIGNPSVEKAIYWEACGI